MAKKICVVGYYFDTHAIIEASRKTRDRGFQKFDAFVPFPVHGIDEALGIKRSCLPYISFVAGCAGLTTAIVLQVWTHMFSWPMNIGAKPILAIPAYVPIFFELTVLFAGVTTAVVMFTKFLGLPNFSEPIFHPDITNDRFALAIEVSSEAEVEPVKRFLKEIYAAEVHHVEGRL
ncbi:MAG: DUF3341 domain-containing protein [Deltaproteobacteria bacterium]|nr:DUF3341 domain-containing protein [Deltaproteobacteria bacterium]